MIEVKDWEKGPPLDEARRFVEVKKALEGQLKRRTVFLFYSETGLSEKLVLEWVNRADLMRVKGVGGEYSELLEAAGVDSVPELAQRNADNLHGKMKEINESKKLVRALPNREKVADWIEQAKGLPRAVSH